METPSAIFPTRRVRSSSNEGMRDSFQELLGSRNPATCGQSLPAVLFCEQNEAGLAGLLTGLGCVFFGFLFPRPRLSRLPITCSF